MNNQLNNQLLPPFQQVTPIYSNFSSAEPSTSKGFGTGKLFNRSRSHSMHSPPPSPVTKDSPTPPLPTSSPLATPTSASLPVTTLIASLSVPYYEARGGRNYVYAVRVVPDAQMSDYDYMAKRAMVKRKASVNKMDADQINFEAVQPYTIYRSWSEFQDLSTRLSMTFPRVRALSRKITIFVTKTTLTNRVNELDTFVRALQYANDPVVGDFFRLRNGDKAKGLSQDYPTSPIDFSPKSFTNLNRKGDATIRIPLATISKRPLLSGKRSVPNLRSKYADDEDTPFSEATIRAPVAPRVHAHLDIPTLARPSSTVTITQLASEGSSLGEASPTSPTATVSPPPKKKNHILRSFRSLQDLRIPSTTVPEIIPPVPVISSAIMARAQTQPMASAFNIPSSVLRRNRSSSKSSSSSFEDSGPALYSTLSLGRSSLEMRPPLGRLHSVPERMGPRASSIIRTRSGHSPSASNSSFDSIRSGSFERNRSLRSSTDYSELSPNTPPTPYLDSGEMESSFTGKYSVNQGILQCNNSVPLPMFFPVPPSMAFQSSVPLQAAYSHDGMSHRRGSGSQPLSLDGMQRRPTRSRTASSSSVRPGLDTICASPKLDCFPSLTSSLGSLQESQILFKIIHTENIALKFSRVSITLASLKESIALKFAESSIILEEDWKLGFQPNLKNSLDSTNRTLSIQAITTEDVFAVILETNKESKISMRIL